MTWLTNDQHACVLVFVPPMVDILNIPCDCQFVFTVLDELMFHTTLDAVGNILKVHYKKYEMMIIFIHRKYTIGSTHVMFRFHKVA